MELIFSSTCGRGETNRLNFCHGIHFIKPISELFQCFKTCALNIEKTLNALAFLVGFTSQQTYHNSFQNESDTLKYKVIV